MRYSTAALLGAVAVVTAENAVDQAAVITDTDDWKALKEIWALLDSAGIPRNQYSPLLEMTKGDSLITVINSLFSNGETGDPVTDRALTMVREMAELRAYRLSRINPMLMTRMMPSWTVTVREDLLFDFETRMQTLAELIREGEISATAYIAARDSLLDRALVISLLEYTEGRYNTGMYLFPSVDVGSGHIETILKALDMTYQAALDSLEKQPLSAFAESHRAWVAQHEEFLLDYEEFQQATPLFRLLMENLMEARR